MKKVGSLYGVEIWQHPKFCRNENGELFEKFLDCTDIEYLQKPMLELRRNCDIRNIKLKSIEVH